MTDGQNERPADIERDIEARREDLAATLEALQERASPRVLVEGMGHALKGESEDLMEAALRMARRNPVAVVMIAAGVAWLAFGPDLVGTDRHRRPGRRRAAERAEARARRRAAAARAAPPRGPVPGSATVTRPMTGPVPASGASRGPRDGQGNVSPSGSQTTVGAAAPARVTPAPAKR